MLLFDEGSGQTTADASQHVAAAMLGGDMTADSYDPRGWPVSCDTDSTTMAPTTGLGWTTRLACGSPLVHDRSLGEARLERHGRLHLARAIPEAQYS